jgi:hypothetical protein
MPYPKYFSDNCLGVGTEESLNKLVKTTWVPTEFLILNVPNIRRVTYSCTNHLFFSYSLIKFKEMSKCKRVPSYSSTAPPPSS